MSATVGVSVLFTDLVDSTAQSARLGAAEADRMRVVHFALLRSAIEANGGREVKNLGDGIMAVFPGTAAALAAAVAMQQAVHAHNRGEAAAPLAIRVGVATGDCTETDGDYFGEPVVQAARLCAAADGGQILTTGVARMLVPRGAYDFDDRGALDLKGLPEPVPALAVRWTPEERTAPPIPLPDRLVVPHLSAMVGRDTERAFLHEALAAATKGERRVVLITGEAGLGKTRIASEFAREAFEDGTLVLYGRCDEELAVPYLPWVDAITHYVRHAPDQELGRLDDTSRIELARLTPAVRTRLVTDDSRTLAESADQYVLFAAVTGLLSLLSAARPVLVVLDDLHWADRTSLQLLRHVVSSLMAAPLMILGTYRETDLGPDSALTETSAALYREPGVSRLPLHGLSDGEVVALVAATAGHELDDDGVSLAHSLRNETAGNPFFVFELLRNLAESGVIAQGGDGIWTVAADLSSIELPQSVRDVVAQRVRRLGTNAAPVLSAAAVVGREFDVAVVARALETDEDEVLEVLESAMNAGIVAEVAAAPDRFMFTHALVRHTLYRELSSSRRARMHERVAGAIEAIVGEEPGERIGELAQHWFAAVRPAQQERAVRYAIEAGDRALAISAPEEAVRWCERALEAIDDDPLLRCRVLVLLGDSERQAGRASSRERLLDAAKLAEDLGADDLLVAAATKNYRGLHSASGAVDIERVAVLERALARVRRDTPDHARLLATLAGELTYSGDPRRFDFAQEAVAVARRTGDDLAVLDAIQRLGSALNVPELLDERRVLTEEALRLTDNRPGTVQRFFALEHRIDVEVASADMAAARRWDAERRTIADQLGQPTLLWLATHGTALLDLVEGDAESAEQGATAALQLGLETGQPDAMVYSGSTLFNVRWHQDRHDELVPLVREQVERNPGLPVFRAVLTIFLVRAGDHDEARSTFAGLASDGFVFPHDPAWITATSLAGEAAALLGDGAAAEVLHERLAPFADQVTSSRANCQGPVAYYLGLLARTSGRREQAEAHFADALSRAERLRAPFHQARALVGLAGLVGERDGAAARVLLERALDLAQRYRMPGLALQAETALAELGS